MIDEQLRQAIASRRSIRDFYLNRKVEQEKIKKIIEAANWAPSACNGQAWHFIIIDEKKILDRLIKKGLLKAKDTPVVIFVYYRKYIKQKPINEYLPDHVNWAYTTIKTMLTRLVAKKVISERKRGNTSVYDPLISKNKARGSALRYLLHQAFDGSVEPLVHSLVDDQKLSKKEREKLIRIIMEEDRKREASS